MKGSVSDTAFRQAMSQFATGVTVVTARDEDGGPLGLTVNSFSSVSLDPPLILFCIDHSAASYAPLRACAGYTVNILSADQEEISRRFARPGPEKWQEGSWQEGEKGEILIDGALTALTCHAHARHKAGDHDIFVGQVDHIHPVDLLDPLLYFRSHYHTIGKDTHR